MADLTDADVKQAGTYTLVLDGDTVPDTARLPIYFNGTLKEITVARLRAALNASTKSVPVVAITAPNVATVGIALSISATATVTGSTIAKVEFFNGQVKIGQATSSPYAITWVPTSGDVGTRDLTAKATDAAGNSTISEKQSVVVSAPVTNDNLPPNITLNVTPAVGAVGDPLAAEVVAVDPDGTIARIELYNYGTLVDQATTSPYVFEYTPQAPGMYFFSAKAYDNNGLSATTKGQTVSVPGSGTTPDPGITTPTYVGVSVTTTPNNAAVQAMPSFLWSKTARQLHFSCNDTYPTFAEPASFGVRSIIQDKNGFNITGDVARTSITLTVNSVATPYYLYVHQNPQFDTDFVEQI